ncbi:MAG TPA: ATP-grasp fold amidoligase family protein [Methylovirgula sp.]|nr:ATP-grasp fold amidoligase family protein [Methylovirgula sp.]
MEWAKSNLERLQEWRCRIRAVRQAYVGRHGRDASIFFPRLYSEKIQWRKLFGLVPMHKVFCDKLSTRRYVEEMGLGNLLSELVWSGTDLAQSPIRSLTFPFVLKSNHASRQYIFVHDPASMNYDELSAEAERWLSIYWGELTNECGYCGIPRRLMIERMIMNPDGSQPIEHRVFVFGGKVKIIASMIVEGGGVFSLFHTADWERLNWTAVNEPYEPGLPRPQRLDEIIAISEKLCGECDHLRIDFYDDCVRLYVGEITVYTWSGLQPLEPPEADAIIGAYWKLDWPLPRALAKIAFGRWGILGLEDHRGRESAAALAR